MATPNSVLALQALGSSLLAVNPDFGVSQITSLNTISDGTMLIAPVYINDSLLLTGAAWFQPTAGNFTADNYNGVGLYSYAGGTLTLVASSANDGNTFKGSNNTWHQAAFTAPYAAIPGLYFIGFLYNSSAQTTAPQIGVSAVAGSNVTSSPLTTNSAKLYGSLAGQSSLPATVAMSAITALSARPFAAVY